MNIPKELIVVVGFGWVGQANALALTKAGHDVCYFDVQKPTFKYTDTEERIYNKVPPLAHVLERDSANTWYLVCVGDKVLSDGTQDISAIAAALKSLKDAKGGVILRSTVLPGYLSSLNFHYYVPEFLHEKKAIEECMAPHYFILGDRGTLNRQPTFFETWRTNAGKIFVGTPEEASYIKYLSNLWNSVRIAFVNEFGDAMAHPENKEKLANIEKIIDFFFERKSYLRYGRSYGGHCLPKDTHAFLAWHMAQGKDVSLLAGTHASNLAHKKIEEKYPYLPEWYSEWIRPQMSGQVALKALRASIVRNIKKSFFGSA